MTFFRLLGVGVAAAAALAACGGEAFGPADGTDGGGTGGDGSAGGDGSTSPADGSSDGAGRQDGAFQEDTGPVTGDASTADGAADASPPTVSCGLSNRCDRTLQVCCYTPSGTGNYAFKCEASSQCQQASGTGIRCNNNQDCAQIEVCCITKQSGYFSSACRLTCSTPDAILCDPSAPQPRCPAVSTCDNSNIDTWGLPSKFATCGGVAAP